MTLAPRDYIAERRREITQGIERLKAELAALDRMESALGDGPLLSPPAQPQTGFKAIIAANNGRRQRIEGGIKSLVLAVLQREPMTANQILAAIKLNFDIALPRTTLSPQLSRLKADDQVSVNDSVWEITEKGRKEAAQKN
jgi:hypothetical protein